MSVLLAVSAVIAYTVKGLTGFANTLVLSTLVSVFGGSILNIPAIELILGTPSNIFIAVRERKSFNWRVVAPLATLMIIGCIPGILFLKSGNETLIKMLFGIGVTLVGLQTLLTDKLNLKPNKYALCAIGIIAGFMAGAYGIGALLVVYVTKTTKTPEEFRANVCFVFILVDICRAIMYSFTDFFTLDILLLCLKLAPFMIAGMAVGTLLTKKLNAVLVKKIIMIMLVLSGVSLMVTNMIALF